MFSKEFITPQKTNSEVVKQVLNTLINTIRRKTDEKHAILTVSSLIKKLEAEYDFLRYIEINDTRLLATADIVNVMPDIDAVSPKEVGKVLHTIVSIMSYSLGDKEGYFLIKELQLRIGSEYTSSVKAMDIDIELLLLEQKTRNI